MPVSSSSIRKADLFIVALVGLLLQGAMALRLEHPTYMDAYYYTTNGQRLAGGYGLTEMIIWQFLDEPSGLPTPSHTYWMPIASLLAAAGTNLVGGFRGAQLPFWVLAGLLPLLAYLISYEMVGQRWQALTAALLTATGGFYISFFGQPSTFAPFAWAGALCLLALARAQARKSPPHWWFLAGLAAGTGHLTRADGLLLLVLGVALWLFHRVKLGTIADERAVASQQASAGKLLWLIGGYLLVTGGWYIRTWQLSGRLFSPVGAQTIFLTTYDDLFAYGRNFDLSHLLGWGWTNILGSKLQGLSVAIQTFAAVCCLIFLLPFVIWGWYGFRKEKRGLRFLQPLTSYTVVLFGLMSLLFTFPGERGGLFHSSAALWPWFMALAASGIDRAVDWMSVRLPHWRPERAKRIFAGLFVLVAFATSLAIGLVRTPNNYEATVYPVLGAQLPNAAVVMVGDAPAFYYHTGKPAVSVPNEPVEVLLKVAQRYGVTHLILDKDHPRSLAALYSGAVTDPALQWIGELDGSKLYAVKDSSS